MINHFKQKMKKAVQFLMDEDDSPSANRPIDKSTNGNSVSALEMEVIDALRTIYDPEIPVNIYDLGLIYSHQVDARSGLVNIEMTLTAPGCPVAQSFPGIVATRIREVQGVSDAQVTLVWDPPWTQERMSDAARLQLGLF